MKIRFYGSRVRVSSEGIAGVVSLGSMFAREGDVPGSRCFFFFEKEIGGSRVAELSFGFCWVRNWPGSVFDFGSVGSRVKESFQRVNDQGLSRGFSGLL